MPPGASPPAWMYASSDGVVLLSGRAVGHDAAGNELLELTEHGVTVAHPALVKIVSDVTGAQTLWSLNSDRAVFTLAPTDADPSRRIVTLHGPLLRPEELLALHGSPCWSSTFQVLLDGPGFPLPRWIDPETTDKVKGTPTFGPVVSSPFHRALLSPLVSPQRRASSSMGGDLSIPPLVLGVSRARAPSISTLAPTLSIQSLLVSAPSAPDIPHVLATALSSHANIVAAEIMHLRRRHDVFARRLKAEAELLEARIAPPLGNGLQVRGFGSSPARSASRSRERERSQERAYGEERGRKTREEMNFADEAMSKRMLAQERAEEDARGRSHSRTRRGDASAAAIARGPAGALLVEATVPDDESRAVPSGGKLGKLSEGSPPYAPHSHLLISIPEQEESSVPTSETGERTPVVLESPGVELSYGEQSGTPPSLALSSRANADADAPFEMDEDIDSDFEIISPAEDSSFALKSEAPASPVMHAQTSASFRPGSYRPSALSSSYAALLSSSYALSRPAIPSPSRKPVPLPSTSPLPPSLESFDISMPTDLPPPDTTTTARTDALVILAALPEVDLDGVREGERKIREALALDAPSHRPTLASRRTPSALPADYPSAPSSSSTTDDESARPPEASRFAVGSLPISIGALPPRTFSNTTFRAEGDVGEKGNFHSGVDENFLAVAGSLRGSGVLSPPALATTESGAGGTGSIGMSISRTAVPPSSASFQPSSLAQSLRNPPPSFAHRAALDSPPSPAVSQNGKEGEEGGFLPPHVWALRGRGDEELLSRSVSKS